MIKNIIFDLGCVLVDLKEQETWEKLAALFGEPLDDFKVKYISFFNQFEKGELSETLFLNKLIGTSKKNINANDIIHIWNSMIGDVPPYKLALLKTLKEKFKLFLLSNTNETHIRYFKQRLRMNAGVEDFDALFDKAYYSYLMHLRKPDVEIFEKVLSDQGLEPGETLFIDDKEENLEGAAKAGLITCLYPEGGPLDKIIAQKTGVHL